MTPTEIQKIRSKTKLSQAQFAELLGVPKGTLQGWEQGRYAPRATAIKLLELVKKGILK